MRKQGTTFSTSAEFDIVRTIKEKACHVSLNAQKEEKEYALKDQYVLPDGHTIKLGAERFTAPEILFQPHIIGLETPGVHQIVVDAINRVDLDLRKQLFSNIVLSGGTTLLKGHLDSTRLWRQVAA